MTASSPTLRAAPPRRRARGWCASSCCGRAGAAGQRAARAELRADPAARGTVGVVGPAPLRALVLAWLVGAAVDPVPFVAVMVSVRVVPYTTAYLLGRWYGEQGLAILRGNGRAGQVTRRLQRGFGRVCGLILALYPGSVVSALAGATGMRPRHFAPLILAGRLFSTGLALILGQVAEGPLLAVTRFIEQSTTWLTLVLLALTVALIARAWFARRGRGTAAAA